LGTEYTLTALGLLSSSEPAVSTMPVAEHESVNSQVCTSLSLSIPLREDLRNSRSGFWCIFAVHDRIVSPSLAGARVPKFHFSISYIGEVFLRRSDSLSLSLK